MLGKLLLRRLALGPLTLWLVSLVMFAAVLALPGDAASFRHYVASHDEMSRSF